MRVAIMVGMPSTTSPMGVQAPCTSDAGCDVPRLVDVVDGTAAAGGGAVVVVVLVLVVVVATVMGGAAVRTALGTARLLPVETPATRAQTPTTANHVPVFLFAI